MNIGSGRTPYASRWFSLSFIIVERPVLGPPKYPVGVLWSSGGRLPHFRGVLLFAARIFVVGILLHLLSHVAPPGERWPKRKQIARRKPILIHSLHKGGQHSQRRDRRRAADHFRADGTGARFESGALGAAETTGGLVDEQGDVGVGVVAEDLASGVEDPCIANGSYIGRVQVQENLLGWVCVLCGPCRRGEQSVPPASSSIE